MELFSRYVFRSGFSLRVVTSRLMHVVTGYNRSSLSLPSSVLFSIYYSLRMRSPINGHLTCFQFLAITDKAAMNSM